MTDAQATLEIARERDAFRAELAAATNALCGLVQKIVSEAYPKHTETFGPPFGESAEAAASIGSDAFDGIVSELAAARAEAEKLRKRLVKAYDEGWSNGLAGLCIDYEDGGTNSDVANSHDASDGGKEE